MSRPLPQTYFDFTAEPDGIRGRRLSELASRLSRTLGIARALAERGRRLDLTGIEDGVGMLCAQSLDLPAGDARCMVPVLREVLTQVESLAQVLRREAPDRRLVG